MCYNNNVRKNKYNRKRYKFMKPKTFGEAMLSIILVIIFMPLMIIAFSNEQETKTTQAMVTCEVCEGACTVSHKVACKTDHNVPDYYYYTYKCEKCGNEFTIEIIQE